MYFIHWNIGILDPVLYLPSTFSWGGGFIHSDDFIYHLCDYGVRLQSWPSFLCLTAFLMCPRGCSCRHPILKVSSREGSSEILCIGYRRAVYWGPKLDPFSFAVLPAFYHYPTINSFFKIEFIVLNNKHYITLFNNK